MNKNKKYFPWSFFWKITFSIFLTATSSVTIFFIFHQYLNLLFLIVVGFILSMMMAYRLTLPFKKIVLRAMRLANKRLFYEIQGPNAKDSSQVKNEEFSELDQYLDQIKTKLKYRSEQMAHSYEESKTLMSGIEEAVISVDQDSQILFFNSAFASKFVPRELLPENPENKTRLSQVFQDPEIINLFELPLKTGQPLKIEKNLTNFLDGSERIFSISVSPLRDKKTHQIFEVMGIFHDISEIRRAEQLRTEFVENASHELRTPLTSMYGYLNIVLQDLAAGDTNDIKDNLNRVSKGMLRLTHLVDDLLTLSQLEHGERLKKEILIPEIITEDIFQKMRPLAQKKNIQMTYVNHGVDELVADPSKLDQVLSNLIGNAIKYINENGSIKVSWHNDPELKKYYLVIKDNGPGIAKNHHARLFERFYRIDRARSREIGGTGLGLAIVKHIMQIHGGTVSVRSDLGEGAEFVCEFPHKTITDTGFLNTLQ